MTEKVARWIANHLPRSVVYFAAIRLIANATVGEWSSQVVPELYAVDALKRWGYE